MMSRPLIEKASSGSSTYRESAHRSNGNLIDMKMCYWMVMDMINKEIKAILAFLK
jgi:hypothetical protein